MGKVQFVKSARKAWKCDRCGAAIEKGMSYYRGEVNFGPTFVRCTKCKLESWEVTSSDYQREVGEIVYRWKQNYGVTEDTIDSIVSDLETIRDDCQDKLDNMPEGLQEGEVGQLLSDRIDQLDTAINDLGMLIWMTSAMMRQRSSCRTILTSMRMISPMRRSITPGWMSTSLVRIWTSFRSWSMTLWRMPSSRFWMTSRFEEAQLCRRLQT